MKATVTEIEIKQVGNVITGKTPSSRAPHHFGSEMPFVTPTDFEDYHKHIDSASRYLSPEGVESLSSKVLPPNSVIVTCIGSDMGKVAMNKVECITNQQINSIVCDKSVVTPHWVYYCLKNLYPTLRRMAQDGTTMPIINKGDFERLQIPYVNLPSQHRIVDILTALDDKIECNLRINHTLEQMAQALYKHWFVDFGPFSDDEFVESEMGLIPDGWTISRLGSVCEINGLTINPRNAPSTIRYIDISSVGTGIVNSMQSMPFEIAPSRARRIIQDGDVVWSMVRPERMSYFLSLGPEPNTIVSTGFAVISPRDVPFSWAYLTTSTSDFVKYLASRATGAAYPAVTSQVFEDAKILLPSLQAMDMFHERVEPWLRQVAANNRENQTLTDTRDYLLPKLLSGEIEVKTTEEQVVALV